MRYSIQGSTPQQIRALGGIEIKELKSIQAVFAELTDAQALQLKQMGATVSAVGKVSISVTPPTPVAGLPTYTPAELTIVAGLEEVRKAISPPLHGEGFITAIIGTGIRKTHQLVGGRVVYSKNFTTSPMEDTYNHDSGVASIIIAVAPKCGLLDLKVLDSKGEGTEEEVVVAIDHCLDLREQRSEFAPALINLSLGGNDVGDPNNILRVACRVAIEKGMWVFAACGNQGPNPGTIMSPACERYVAAIGSAKYLPDSKSFVASDFSSRGPTPEGIIKPDCIFFGEDVEMASSASDTATIAKSGTSFSTPFTSGIAMLHFEAMSKYREFKIPNRPPEWVPEGAYLPTVTMERLLDYWLKTFTLKPEGIPHVKDTVYGEGLPFGPLILQSVKTMLAPGLDISSLLSIMPIFVMVGMMSKMMPKLIKAKTKAR